MSIQFPKLTKWWYGVLGLFLLSASVGIGALFILAQSPESNCRSLESQSADAGAIIYCATSTVDEQDSDKLNQAIQLVNAIPQDNPLRASGDKLIERWSQALMYLSEKAFHEGDITKAVDTAELIPGNIALYQTAKSKIKQWQTIWSQAENIYETASSDAKDEGNGSREWYMALAKAKELKTLDNQYWATTKYQELVHQIQNLKEEKEKADQEQKIAKAQEKKEAQEKSQLEVQQETDDFTQLKKARTLASSQKIDDMRAAVIEASIIISEPHHQEARKLIAETEKKIATLEDAVSLENANKAAMSNDAISLEMAINEASLIGKERPLYNRATQQIAVWRKKKAQVELKNEVVEKKDNKLDFVSHGSSSNRSQKKPKSQIDIPASIDIKLDEMRLEEFENQQIEQVLP